MLKWGIRLVYVQLFIVMMSALGQWGNPFTFFFIGGILIFAYSGLVYLKEPEGSEEAELHD